MSLMLNYFAVLRGTGFQPVKNHGQDAHATSFFSSKMSKIGINLHFDRHS